MEPTNVAPEPDAAGLQGPELDRGSGGGGGGGGGSQDDPNRKKQNVRKRTKTGCITCRKRRIKCDEGRPTCNNCLKSKRMCEGYNQRVVFKEPMGAFHGGPFGPVVYPSEPAHHFGTQLASAQANKSATQGPLPIIAPKPPPFDFSNAGPSYYGQPYLDQPGSSGAAEFIFHQQLLPGQMPLSNVSVPPMLPSPTAAPLVGESPPMPNAFFPSPISIAEAGLGETHGLPMDDTGRFPSSSPVATGPMPVQAARPVQFTVPPDDELGFDDDYSMGESDDEIRDDQIQQFGAVMERRFEGLGSDQILRMRTFHQYSQDATLTTYMPSAHNHPLTDRSTAAMFWHFVNVTGPSMSLYERHPMDHSDMTEQALAPMVGQSIWTYTFPITAFSHPALLQAMLAIGALQVAKLRGVPATAAMKHYHLALRRVAKNVCSPSRRTHQATIAASLLLGYFEVWNSDHQKWCNHMYGASTLFKDVPLREMTRTILPLKRRKRIEAERAKMEALDRFGQYFPQPANVFDDDELDVNLIRMISGIGVSAADMGQELGESLEPGQGEKYSTHADIENYEHFRDLWWWNAKMDIYQSILGGTKLFTDYEKWTHCAPRAPIGKLNAIYGTFDHLLLLLGRSVSFAAKDWRRKMTVFKKNKPKKPRPGPGPSPPPGQGGPKAQSNSPPMFPGMLPTSGQVQAPLGFSPPPAQSWHTEPATSAVDDDSVLEAARQEALREWDTLLQAFELVRGRFGPEFAELSDEYADLRDTPFGPTLQYRTFSVAGIWLNYYMGLIHLYRAHPDMPPASMVAAGVIAHKTGQFANNVGRIAAGLVVDDISLRTEISTLEGAALIESSFCLFVAAVQYQDERQRSWTIRRTHDIARLTGWQSARQIAEGCETAWRKAGEMGHGPRYVRPPELDLDIPQGMWSSSRRIVDRHRHELLHGRSGPLMLAKSELPHYAVGLVWAPDDLDRVELTDRMSKVGLADRLPGGEGEGEGDDDDDDDDEDQ